MNLNREEIIQAERRLSLAEAHEKTIELRTAEAKSQQLQVTDILS
jgi:hypothetical protein